MQPVKFLRRSPPYNVGDVAGFDDAVTERLIAAGVAEPARPSASRPADAAVTAVLDRPSADRMMRPAPRARRR